jgi:FixJ family two-component response regulator
VKVYVVDDDESVRHAIVRLLRSAGIVAQGFASAEEFLEADVPEKDSCLVSDIRLPGISGVDLKEEMDKRGNAMPVIFITGHDAEEMRRRARMPGVVAYFRKPVDAQALLDAIGFIEDGGPNDRRSRKSGVA